jgi:hypothetical protein
LRALIASLEKDQEREGKAFKQELKSIYENLQPINLIKNTISQLKTTPSLKENLLDITIELAIGYISKKVIVGSTHNPLKQLFGTLLEIGVMSLVSKNTDSIKSIAFSLFNKLFNNETSLPK